MGVYSIANSQYFVDADCFDASGLLVGCGGGKYKGYKTDVQIDLKYRNIGKIWPKLIKSEVNKLCVLSFLDPF